MLTFPWFKRIGPVFLPIKIPGWIILAGALVYAVYVFIDIDRRSHSVSDTLINFVFNAFLIGLIYSIISYFTSYGTEK